MAINYSKWDALELSDDSDIEVHPNVDKRSFIRAKQSQIHMERAQRKHEIETLKYERIINDGLISRISGLFSAFKASAAEAATRNPAEVAFQAVMETASTLKPEDDRPPPPPEGVHKDQPEQPTYTKMMAALLDQVNQALQEKKVTQEERYGAMMAEIESHLTRVQDLQVQLEKRLAELEKQDKGKITSESIHTGFDSSHVNKAKPTAASSSSTVPELLNPNFAAASGSAIDTGRGDSSAAAAASSSSAKAGAAGDDEAIDATPEDKQFAAITPSDYTTSVNFLSSHPSLLTERSTDALLMLAFDHQLQGHDDAARGAVHQGLLLQYCRALGRDGVGLFFKRVMTPNHQARNVFLKDVADTYAKIRNRVRELLAQQAKEGESSEGVEQIQLQAMEPGTVISIKIPSKDSEDPDEKAGRAIFETFSADMRAALETGSLDEVNKALGRMKVADAEEIVGKFGEAGILSLEDEIIDATTDEGKAQIKEIEARAAANAAAAASAASTEKSQDFGDPE